MRINIFVIIRQSFYAALIVVFVIALLPTKGNELSPVNFS